MTQSIVPTSSACEQATTLPLASSDKLHSSNRQGALCGLNGMVPAAALLLQQRYIAFLFYEARLASWELHPQLGLDGKVMVDLDAAAPVIRFHWPDDSKGAAPSWPSFRAQAVLGLLGLTDEADPHPAWASAAAELRAWINSPERGDWPDEESEPHLLRLDGLVDRIAETPARTSAGIVAQVALALRCHDAGSVLGISEIAALRNAQASLERLAGDGTAAPHPDAELLALGEEMERLRAAERETWRDPGEGEAAERAVEAAAEAVSAVVERIIVTPATTLAGLIVKARALDWCCVGETPYIDQTGGSTDVRVAESIVVNLLAMGGQADA